jgi:hypothetical protein
MKILLIISLLLAASLLLFQLYLVLASKNSETQNYQVVFKGKTFEIRHYPTVAMATINSTAKTYQELGSSGFGVLAKYIFGGNERNLHIAMTSPVHMDINDYNSSMSFVMPSKYLQENLPKPINAEVIIETAADEYVAAVGFGGFATETDSKINTRKLERALKAASIDHYGSFRMLGYNPPFQLLGRRNEIIVNVEWDQPKK